MMNYKKIDMNTWERKDKYQYFTTEEKCEISLTCDIDVTELVGFCKQNNIKFYPAMICTVSRVVNCEEHFKMGFNENGELVVFDSVNPCYTDFIPELEDFNTMTVPYSSDMKAFYRSILDELQRNKGIPCPSPENGVPNMFYISSLPWINYSSINLHYFNEFSGLAPLVYWGKYVKKEGKLMIPVTLQARHAVCDGYHVAKFFMDIEKNIPKVMEELS